ncbi:MAG: 2-C-methyl-D-erythritol 4-phosphate cytidylyltransferase, partial [Nitrospirae bacterium]
MAKAGKVVAVVPAGGAGKRMGAGTPKQFLMLDGVPMMLHSLRALERTPGVTEIVLVVPKGEQARALTEVVERYGLKKVRKVVPGGATRQESVHHGLNEVDEDVEIVVVHDAVRPFVTEDLVTRSIEAARRHGGAIAAVPMKDTPKQAGPDGLIRKTL